MSGNIIFNNINFGLISPNFFNPLVPLLKQQLEYPLNSKKQFNISKVGSS